MPDHDNRTPSGVDLTRPTESTRRKLYDAVVQVHFTPSPDEVLKAQEDPDNHWVPDYGPDDAELTVWYDRGRWYAAWKALEELEEKDAEPPAAAWRRWAVVRIVEDPESATGLTFLEV